MFSVKYLFGEANIAYNFLLLKGALKFPGDRTIFEDYLINSLRFSED